MLSHLRIRDLGVIGESAVDLSEGLCVLTGETGAGKTMIVTSLGLLLGGRADSTAVRAGAASAAVDGVFVLPAAATAVARAREAGADLDELSASDQDPAELELVVTRSVSAAGRGRAHLGGRLVPVGVLGELADDLVAVHGQSDQVLLRSPARQRDLLDGFGGRPVATALAAYTAVFDELAAATAELAEITTQSRARRQEAELLRMGVSEVERVAPTPGEDHDLRVLSQRLEHASELVGATTAAHNALVGADDDPEPAANVSTLLATARHQLEQVSRLDPGLAELAARTTEVTHLVVDLAADLASYSAGVESDPALLASTHERRAELTALVRKYGDDIDAVLAWAQQAATRLENLDSDDDRIDELTAKVATLQADLTARGQALSKARGAAATRLAKAVSAELKQLSMPGAKLTVEISPRTPARHGSDDVTFLLAAHRGAEPRPLGKGASGGELSRVMLAIEVATMAGNHAGTLVFDEVDAGVGGRAAVQIGRRLADLAQHAQVLVVTHLPQVAAYADLHLVVAKTSDGQVTHSGVHQVSGEERVREIARMMAGSDESSAAQQHAVELLEQAAAERNGTG